MQAKFIIDGVFFLCLDSLSDGSNVISIPLFDDVQHPGQEVGHVCIQSRKTGPSAT